MFKKIGSKLGIRNPLTYCQEEIKKELKYKIEIEVDPTENGKIEALKNDGFKLQQRSEYRFIDIYSKYI